jgi:Tol biopolymer transport system component/tRNA A-37 threonylcarbamoyl transferase component Bud32
MPLQPGTRLGPHEILEAIGAGGMGVVYRARDTKLNRDVAIKVLLPEVANDPEQLRRFEREAHLLASLNHPNVAAIYGFEEAHGITALVLELVEGPTLAERIASGPLAIGEALAIARQIADALETAHERGIVHRDLKPANVKVTPDGTVKVLDFGIAKAVQPLGADATPHSKVETAFATREGVIAGTAPYMSPEQARGKPVDKRADIWAFGCLLYEALTVTRAFPGETTTDALAAVIHREPDWALLPAATPASIRGLLARCLEKDPKRRLRDIGEARVAIEATLAGDVRPTRDSAQSAAFARWRRALPWAIAAMAAMVAVWAMYRAGVSRSTEPRWQKFTQLTDLAGEEDTPAISPDGVVLAFTSRTRGSSDIYVQRIGGRNPILVAGDPEREEAAPAFSPDGQRLAFHEQDTDGGIFIVGATGESVRRLTDKGFHPAWSPDGRSIAYCTEAFMDRGPTGRMGVSALWIVSVESGQARKLDDGDAVQPAWSPSGTRIAFWGATIWASGARRDMFTIPATGGPRVAVLEDAPVDWSPVWAPNGRSLYFASDRAGVSNLWRIDINESTGRALGNLELVTGGVQAAADLPSLSRDGTKLVYRSRVTTVIPFAVPFDPEAERLLGGPKALFERSAILAPKDVSPDGRWLALGNFGEPREDIFIARTDGTDLRRLTDDVARDRAPMWSPDGRELAFYSNRTDSGQIWTIRSDGSGLTQRADANPGGIMYPLWSPAGDRMVGSLPRIESMTGYMWDLAPGWSSAKPLPGLSTSAGWLRSLDWSRDGTRLAGVVQDAGANAIGVGWYNVVTGASAVVSHDRLPTPSDVEWLPDSRRILFVNDRGELVIVDADTKRRKVLSIEWPFHIADESVAVAPDGRTIYVGGRKVESDIWMVER